MRWMKMKKHNTSISEKMNIEQQTALLSLNLAFRDIQYYCGLDKLEFFAILGKAVGGTVGLNDVITEKEFNLKENDEALEPYKKTLLLNFDVSYNQTRSEE